MKITLIVTSILLHTLQILRIGSQLFLAAFSNFCRLRLKALTHCTETCAVASVVFNIAGIENKDISVYPNPASDKIMVKAGKNISDMVLYNVKGEAVLVKRGSSLNGQSVIEINGLNDGIYFLKIVTSDGTSTKKIIKK